MPKFKTEMHHFDSIQRKLYGTPEEQETCLPPLCQACSQIKGFELAERIAAALERLVAILEAKKKAAQYFR